MEESEGIISVDDIKEENDTYFYKIKPKKRSLVERELETNLTERITSPIIINGGGTNTSRYGRARRLKTDPDKDTEKSTRVFKSPVKDKSPIKSPVYKMHASNSPIRGDAASKTGQNNLDVQIESIYNENISLSRFSDDKKNESPVRQSPKVYVRKDLIQTKEKEETLTLIKNYSPKSSQKLNTHLNKVLQISCERYSINNNKQNGYLSNSSVVKTLDFDGNKKKKKESKGVLSKSEIFDIEAKCEYQVGDLAWAKMGTYPYWPCIVTRDPFSGMFVKKKLFGRVDRDVIHVSFFGDNGRRSWIVDNMLRKFLGQLEFEAAREKLTPEARKKDPRCAAFFVSEKKMPQWTISVEEAETLLREPKRLRIDLYNDMLNRARTLKTSTTPKGSRKVSRTDSDVSLSESLYDTLFSEDDCKTSDLERSKSKTRNKSLDVSEVVTACLDNMAAKTGITKIQKQSHMDRWLQKAKSKTPEKSQLKSQTNSHNPKQDMKRNKNKRVKKEPDVNKSFKFTLSDNESLNETDNKLHAHQNEHDYSVDCSSELINDSLDQSKGLIVNSEPGLGIILKVESLGDKSVDNISNDIPDDEDVCIVVEETIVNANTDVIDSNEISNIVINNIKTIEDAETCIIDSAVSKSFVDRNKISMNVSNDQIMCKSNEIINDVNVTNSTSNIIPAVNQNINTHLNDSKTCKTVTSDIVKEAQMETNSEGDTNSSTELQKHLTNGHKKMNINCELYLLHETPMECTPPTVDSSEDVTGNIGKETNDIQDIITATEDEEKQEVNIEKTIITDKLVGNDVDFNKIEFNIDVNEIPTDTSENFIVNDDSNLTIPESNGLIFKTTIDDCNNVKNYADTKSTMNIDTFCKASNILEYDNITDRSKYETNKSVHNEEITLNVKNTCEEGSVCSSKFNGDSIKKVDGFKDYLASEKFRSDSNVNEGANSGFAQSKDNIIRIDPTINCNLYLSSEDDDTSTNSTPTDINGLLNIDKCKPKFVKKDYKHLTLQDALRRTETDNRSVIIDQDMASHEKFIDGIEVTDESDRTSGNVHEEVSTVDDRSQNNSRESEHSSTESNFPQEEISNVYDGSQNTTAESERSSTDSNCACDSDIKSIYSDAQTDKSVIRETPKSTEAMDADDSSFDSISQNSYHASVKIGHESEFFDGSNVCLQVNLSKEKAIMSGDELRLTPHGLEVIKENCVPIEDDIDKIKDEKDADTASVVSTDSEISLSKRKMRWKTEKPSLPEKKIPAINMEDPDFLKYLELKQDAIYDEHPELSQDEITTYLYNTWLYEESLKTDRKKTDDIESASMVKGLKSEAVKHPKKVRKRIKVEKEKDYEPLKEAQIVPKQKPKRRTVRPSYNEEYTDIEEDLEVYRIPKPKELNEVDNEFESIEEDVTGENSQEVFEEGEQEILDEVDEVEEYFARLTEPKPNVFKGLLREKVCEICEKTGNLVKCKGCSAMFHVDCVKKETKVIEVQAPTKGRKKKKKFKGRKSKSDEHGLDENQSDEKDANISEELVNTSMESKESEPYRVANLPIHADEFEAQLALKMKELLGDTENIYNDTFSSEEELDWSDTEVGKCEVVDIKLRKKEDESADYSDFKCNNCQKYDVPICFVCRRAESPKNNALHRQRCQVPHCNKYFHLECLEHWPQTQFNSGECARYNKKINEYFEALTCPRHVCHTCVSDDPRGCKTRFSGDKLARCVRCPATYHTFTKCVPAGTQILTGSHIICPRHHEHRPGKIPCHVNTGWCFICALGGTLICCEYCPTSFHAECLNIKPPEGGYMCEDCETGRLPLYGEMVWVKLGHYRWWPGIILHPCEIPENIIAVKHSPGEFVVRFFGQYDHYWVNRGRVFPFQEGDSGKVSSQKSKIDAAFTMAMEHAQRACEILKTAAPNEEESLDIASSLLPPHYVKLRVNKPCGALSGRKIDEESSLTQCECSPDDEMPCGPYSHCLNRMLLTECGPTCRAGDRCNNRAFEKRLYPKLVPYRTPYRGWGLKTLEDIKAGQFVIEYVGELIDEEEFQRRMRRKHEIRDENYYFLTLDKERMIDAGPKGNLARFMNHCCEPNCETQKWTVLGDVRVGLFALYDIPANSEVTFNYNLESAGIEKKRCLCGAKRCSGYIGAKLKQAEQPKKLKRPYNKKRKIEDSPSTSKIKPKPKLGRPPKPKELTEIEKDLLIIKNATNGISSDSECCALVSSTESIKDLRPSKRKRVGQSTEESSSNSNSPSTKKIKLTEERLSETSDSV